MKSIPLLRASIRCLDGRIEQFRCFATSGSLANSAKYETLHVTKPKKHIVHVQLHRPKVLNAFNERVFTEIKQCFAALHADKECRAIVLSGSGRMFSAGLDLTVAQDLLPKDEADSARVALKIRDYIGSLHDSFLSVSRCEKPVIAAVHGGCIGAGINLVGLTDIRYCSKDAYFQIKEADIAIAADLGILQVMPRIAGNDSVTRELAYTARKLLAPEALSIGFVGRVCEDHKSTLDAALETAEVISKKTPIAIRGIKTSLDYSRDHSLLDGLNYMRNWNMAMFQTDDLMKAGMSVATKSDPPEFEDA